MIKKILFVSSEAVPFIKTGGLADVIGSLPIALKKKSFEVSVVLPLYSGIIKKFMSDLKLDFSFKLNENIFNEDVRVFSYLLNGIKFYFIENRKYFERNQLYGYLDDGERFAFFQHAVYKMILEKSEFPDLIHSHDWHAGMMAALASIYHRSNLKIRKIKHIFTIHNLAYQGNFDVEMLETCLGIPLKYFYDGTMRYNSGISFMKAGILFSDKISTVSNTYSQEILSPEYGEGMSEILKYRKNDLWGIVNGINLEEYNPETDDFIKQKFSLDSLELKNINKSDLQEKLGLKSDKNICLIGMVTRLTSQKGIDLVIEKIQEIMALNVQLVILGTGDSYYENKLKEIEKIFKGNFVYYIGYSESIARKIFAASDIFLMPSKYEPCGISQLIAMRYGSLPLVRETGGLKDTVSAYNKYEKTGTGFSFKNFNSDDLIKVLDISTHTFYNNKSDFKLLQKNAMKKDLSWDKSAELYTRMYKSL